MSKDIFIAKGPFIRLCCKVCFAPGKNAKMVDKRPKHASEFRLDYKAAYKRHETVIKLLAVLFHMYRIIASLFRTFCTMSKRKAIACRVCVNVTCKTSTISRNNHSTLAILCTQTNANILHRHSKL